MAEPAKAVGGEALSEAADGAIEACDGDARAAVVALLAMNNALERELAFARVAVSSGFSRGWHHRERQ